MLEIQNLTAGYPHRKVLQDISVTFPKGAVTVIIGPNGCGKSTLLKAIAGILPYSGRILWQGRDLTHGNSRQRAQTVAFLPQSRQVPEITVKRLVLHGRFPYLSYPRHYRREDHAAAEAAMTRMGIADLAERSLVSLSGGQRQKAYIAMALAQETEVVLLDEPTTYLDISHQMQLLQQANALAQSGRAVILVLHDLALALEHAHQLLLMHEGRAVCQGDAQEIFASGQLAKVFGVTVKRVKTEDGWKYYCI